MVKISEHLSAQDIRNLANLQLLARQVVEGFCSGLHRSPHKGFSVEFKQHRQYVPGDELRHLDWKVFGKTDRFYIREYEEETNLRCTILLDQSGSMAYKGSRALLTKHEYAVRLAASFGYLLLQQQDAVGLVSFDTQIREHIPPRARPAHLGSMIKILQKARPGGETALSEVFRLLVPKIHRRSLLIIFSDLFDNVPNLLKSLAQFRHQKHEIIVFQIWDPDELDFPFQQRTMFESLEDPERKQMVDPAHLRNAYLKNLERYRQELRQGCYRHRIDLVPVVTDQPYAEALAQHMAIRRKAGASA